MREKAGVYFDEHDLPVHLDGGGDGLNRLGFFHTALAIRRIFMGLTDPFPEYDHLHLLRSIDKLHVSQDLWVRSLNPPYNDPRGKFSPGRDQFRPIYTALALYHADIKNYRCDEYLIRFRMLHERRKLYGFQNFDIKQGGDELDALGYNAKLPFGYRARGDIGTSQDKNLFARGVGDSVSWLGDYMTVYTSDKLKNEKDPDYCDSDITHVCTVMLGLLKQPTYLSKKAAEIYKQRFKGFGVTELHERSAVQGALSWYFRPPNPWGLADLWRPITEMYLT